MPSMGTENTALRELFGGAAEAQVPARLSDISTVRAVPDNQEVLADPTRDESLVVELLELKEDVADADAAAWFFNNLCSESDATSESLLSTAVLPDSAVPNFDSVFKCSAVGQMVVSKVREGPHAGNLVRCYLANLRLRSVSTDVLITVYEPLVVSASSSTAGAVGVGEVSQQTDALVLPAARVFELFLSSFKVKDWGLFGS